MTVAKSEAVRLRLRSELMRRDEFKDALLAIGTMQLTDERQHCIWLTFGSCGGVFDSLEIEYFASVISGRVENGTWGLSLPVGGHREQETELEVLAGSSTIELAAAVLARRLAAARRGLRDEPDGREHQALSRALRHVPGADRAAARDALRSLAARSNGTTRHERNLAAQKRADAVGRRERRSREQHRRPAEDERARLDAEVARGTMRLVADLGDDGAIYTSS